MKPLLCCVRTDPAILILVREDVKIPTYKPHTNHKRSSVRSHTLAPTSICDLSHRLCWRPLTDLGHISSVTYVCHPLWFVCGHRKGILTSPLNTQCMGIPWWIQPLSWSVRTKLARSYPCHIMSLKGKLAHKCSTCYLECISYQLPMDKKLMTEKIGKK